MNAVDRLRAAIALPIVSDGADGFYDEWWPSLHEDRATEWRPRRGTFRAAILRRIEEAGEAWSLRMIFRRTNDRLRDTLMASTPEFEWFRSYPKFGDSRGMENKVPLTIAWGKS